MVAIWQAFGLLPIAEGNLFDGSLAWLVIALIFFLFARASNKAVKEKDEED